MVDFCHIDIQYRGSMVETFGENFFACGGLPNFGNILMLSERLPARSEFLGQNSTCGGLPYYGDIRLQ